MILPSATADLTALTGSVGGSWWQTVGGLVAVFGLLVLCLRLLNRFHHSRGASRASMLAVWHLGPKREIQVLRLGEDVHYVYRHDGAMVVLDHEALTAWQSRRDEDQDATSATASPLPDLKRLKAFVARAGGRDQVVRTSSR